MKRITLSVFLLGTVCYLSAQELPQNPTPGKCYVKCITPDEYQEETLTVEVSPSYKVSKVIPATYKVVEERVMTKEPSKKLVYVPAVYETVTTTYVQKESAKSIQVIPASFGTEQRSVEVQPKAGRWEYKVLDNCPSANKQDCMVACFVEYPAVSETLAVRTLMSDAKVVETAIPEIEEAYKMQRVKVPAKMEEIEIPAEYKVIKRKIIDQPARVVDETVPAVTKTITKRVLQKKGGITVWEEVDCNLVSGANILPILYEYNSARLTPESVNIIDEHLLKLMQEKPNLRIEIMSHTDSRGNDDYNMSLSQQRAQSVVNYLVSKGISRERLVAKGYGESMLKNRCSNGVSCSEEQHHENRRTEFRIIQ